MPCLGHDKRFRSVLQAVANQLRKEERTSKSVIRALPRQCCTCQNDASDTVELVAMKENDTDHQWMNIQSLRERIKKVEPEDQKLIRSFNELEKIIRENRAEIPMVTDEPVLPKPTRKSRVLSRRRWSSASSSSDSESVKPQKPTKKHKQTKRLRKIKQGTFVFLPFKATTSNRKQAGQQDPLVAVAQSQQLKRFLGPKGHFGVLEGTHKVQINVVTPKTTAQITDALEDAKKGMENLTIYKEKETIAASENLPGVWVLVRPKAKKSTTDVNAVLDKIIDQWKSCLAIEKRPFSSGDSESDDVDGPSHSDWKPKPSSKRR